MSKSKTIFILFTMCMIALNGCAKNSTGREVTVEFLSRDTEIYLPVTEYSVTSLDDAIVVYFPIITNKEITNTELGGVGAKFTLSNGSIKAKLKPDMQNSIMEEYNGYFISFLKYSVNIDGIETIREGDSIALCDTKLWIYHKNEFETIEFNESYLQIHVVGDKEMAPEWGFLIAEMQNKMKHAISEF